MACKSCRRQLSFLSRQTNAIVEAQNAILAQRSSYRVAPSSAQKRSFRNIPRQQAPILKSIRDGIGKAVARQAEPYRVVHATESIYKACAKEAVYSISPAHKKAGTIPKTAEGEDIGEGDTMWHKGAVPQGRLPSFDL
jgi:cytochrome b pre-mRNA-processing protein 3